jgi:hypothetical protein
MIAMTMPSMRQQCLKKRPATISGSSRGLDANWVRRSLLCYTAMDFTASFGPPMTLGKLRQLGVQRLVAYYLRDPCRHQGLIDVSKYPDDVEVPSFAGKIVCAKCGARGRRIDVRPNWKHWIAQGLEPDATLTGTGTQKF